MSFFSATETKTVNSANSEAQFSPDVAALSNGNIVVVWGSQSSSGSLLNYDLTLKIIQPDGTAVTSEQQLSLGVPGIHGETEASIIPLADGGFAVAFNNILDYYAAQDAGLPSLVIALQSFSETGEALGQALRLNSLEAQTRWDPQLVQAADESLFVTWTDNDQFAGTGSGSDVFLREFGSDGQLQDQEDLVNSSVTGSQTDPSITKLTDGKIVVTWLDGNADQIKARLHDEFGTAIGAEFTVSETSPGYVTPPKIAALTDGNFAITWSQHELVFNANNVLVDVEGGVFFKILDATGGTILPATRAHDEPNGYLRYPDIATLDGGFVINWINGNDRYEGYQSNSIAAQVFDESGTPVEDVINIAEPTAGRIGEASITGSGDSFHIVWSGSDVRNDTDIQHRAFTLNDGILSGSGGDNTGSGNDGDLTTIYEEDFSDGHDASHWDFFRVVPEGNSGRYTSTLGSAVSINDGSLLVQQDRTDNGGFAALKVNDALGTDETLSDFSISYDRFHHAGGQYYTPSDIFFFEGHDDDFVSVHLQFQSTDWRPSFANDEANRDKIRITVSEQVVVNGDPTEFGLREGSTKGEASNTFETSSQSQQVVFLDETANDYFDQWTTIGADFDAETGMLRLDIEGDGTYEAMVQDDALVGASLKEVGFGNYGWFTGHYGRVDNLKIAGDLGDTNGSATEAGDELFFEDFQAATVGALPDGFTIVYDGLGTSYQDVRADAGEKYLDLQGRSGWTATVRKDVDVDLPDTFTVEADVRLQDPGSFSRVYSDPSVGTFSVLGALKFKEEGGTGALSTGLSFVELSDGKAYAYFGPSGDKTVFEVGYDSWFTARLVVDSEAETQTIFIDETEVGTIDINVYDAAAPWSGHTNSAGFVFKAENHGNTTTQFDNLTIIEGNAGSGGNETRNQAPDWEDLTGYGGVDDSGQIVDFAASVGDDIEISLGELVSDPDGDRMTITVADLPDGLSFDPVTWVISGTLTTPGSSDFSLMADDGNGNVTTQEISTFISASTEVKEAQFGMLTFQSTQAFETKDDATTASDTTLTIGATEGDRNQLIVRDADVSIDDTTAEISGTFFGQTNDGDIPLFTGSVTIDTQTGKGKIKQIEAQGGDDIVGGLVDILYSADDTFQIFDAATLLDSDLGVGVADLNVATLDPVATRITDTGRSIIPEDIGVQSKDAPVLNFLSDDYDWGIKFEDLSATYDFVEDALYLRGQASAELDELFNGTLKKMGATGNVTLDLAGNDGEHFVRISELGGELDWDVVGSLAYEADEAKKKQLVQSISLELDTVKKTVGGDIDVYLPAFKTGLQAGATFIYDPFAVETVTVGLDDLRVPLGASGLMLTGGSLGLDNLAQIFAKDDSGSLLDAVLSGRADLQLATPKGAPPVFTGYVDGSIGDGKIEAGIGIDITPGTLTSPEALAEIAETKFAKRLDKYLGISLSELADFGLLSANAKIKANLDQGKYSLTGDFELAELLEADGSLVISNPDDVFTINADLSATVTWPESWWFVGGKTFGADSKLVYTDNNDSSDDFVMVYTLRETKLGSIGVGFRLGFDMTFDFVGLDEIELVGSWDLAPSNALVSLTAFWENSVENVELVVITPDGDRITEDQFGDYDFIEVSEDFNSTTQRTVFLRSPELGRWDIETVQSEDTLGATTYEANEILSAPAVQSVDVTVDNANKTARIDLDVSEVIDGLAVDIFVRDLDTGDRQFVQQIETNVGQTSYSSEWDFSLQRRGDFVIEAETTHPNHVPIGTSNTDVVIKITTNPPIQGTQEADNLFGTANADKFVGLDGDDTFIFNNVGDRATEKQGGGFDLIYATVQTHLGSAEIEQVILEGNANARVYGNRFATQIDGNEGSNVLIGGGGGDVLTGGEGKDFFAFQINDADGGGRIVDFSDNDKIALDDRFFNLGDSTIDVRDVTDVQVSNALRSGTVSYSGQTGEMFIDRDGRNGPENGELILVIEGGGRVTADDFLLF